MDNLKTARLAIDAELATALEGLAYYEKLAASLRETLSTLPNASIPGTSQTKSTVTSKTKSKKITAAKPKAAKQPASKSKGKNALPSTGGDYWPDLITSEPQSFLEVIEKAKNNLGFVPSKTQSKQLANRGSFALRALVNAKKIKDSGSGRDRKFFK